MGVELVLAMAGLPSYGNHGGAQTCMGLIKGMLACNYKVTVLSLYDNNKENPYFKYKEANENSLKALGVNTIYINYDQINMYPEKNKQKMKTFGYLRNKLFGNMVDSYPWVTLKSKTEKVLKRTNPDVIFCYHFEPLAAMYGVHTAPKIAGVGDPTHAPYEAKITENKPKDAPKYVKNRIGAALQKRKLTPLMREMLNDCNLCGAFAYHYSKWYNSIGVKNVEYFRTPLADPLEGKDWQDARKKSRIKLKKPRIMLMGDLRGTATKLGLKIFISESLKELDKRYGEEGYEVHIIGGGRLDESLKKFIKNDQVILRGRVDPPNDEFLKADVLVVPTPVDLGIRVRILTAFSFGCPVVAHNSNAKGIPELENNENVLMDETGVGLANCIMNIIENDAIREKLENNGRNTFEKKFKDDIACAKIVKSVESLLGK